MDINIRTKYNIGDTVYVAINYYEYYPQKIPYIITDISVKVNEQHSIIAYSIKQDGCIDCVSEEWLFDTYEECTNWCKKQNQNLSILSMDKTK